MIDRHGSATRPDANDQTTESAGGRAEPAGDPPPKIVKSARDARQGRIVLDAPRKRWIFGAGLVGFILLLAIVAASA